MRTILAVAAVVLGGCGAPDAPFWCTSFCDAVGRQNARCSGGNATQVSAACAQQLACPQIRTVRSVADLQTCIRDLDGACFTGSTPECMAQFGR